MTFGDKNITETDWKKDEKLEKEINDLLENKNYEKWEWENPGQLSLEDPSSPISVITTFRAETAGTERPYFKKKEEFIKQMATILYNYGFTIPIGKVKDEVDTSKGLKYRRIDIFYELKSRN